MPFNSFINPYQNPADVPEKYRKHSALQKLFKADGAYVRPAEDPVTIWAIDILHAEAVVAEAKARVERMILGEENAA